MPWSGARQGTQRVAFAPGGKTLASALGAEVALFDLATRQTRSLSSGTFSHVRCLAFSPDGAILAAGGTDPKIELFDVRTGQVRAVLLGHREHMQSLTFSPDGRTLASLSEVGEVKLWDVFTGRELASPSGPQSLAHCLALSPDGTRLAVAGLTTDELGQLGEVVVWHAPRKETMNEK